jgi:hypothetical protein
MEDFAASGQDPRPMPAHEDLERGRVAVGPEALEERALVGRGRLERPP